MGLFIKREIQKLLTGYPTVSDKYDVQGGILGGAVAAKPGDLLIFGANQGEFAKPATAMTGVDQIAGILLGVNVKLVLQYPGASAAAETMPGQAVDLCTKGFIPVELEEAVTADIKDGAAVKCLLASGKLTTSSNASGTEVPNMKFTGVFENHGTEAAPVIVAEIKIGCQEEIKDGWLYTNRS